MGVSLKLEDIEVAYGAATVLDLPALSVQPGEFFSLLGPSGCGKTTLMGVIAGLVAAKSGSVRLDGEDVTDLPPQRRRIGLVFQSYALFPHMRVADNIAYGLSIRGIDKAAISRRVADMLALVHLDGKGDRYPRQLSGGEQQRVAIARALAVEPRLLLLDEPLSNLDAKLRDEMRVELKRIQREAGVTTLFVTHDQAEALGMGDRVAILNRGRLEQIGSPESVYRNPASRFVATFIGRSNVIACTVERHDGARRLCRNGLLLHTDGPIPDVKLATLYLRPEELRIGNADGAPNEVRGRIVEIVYAGSTVSYRISSELGEIEVCRLGEEMLAEKGETVRVSWTARAGHVMAEAHG